MRQPTAQERKLFGDLAEDVVELREAGKVIAPFRGMYRVNNQETTASGVVAMAAKVRSDRLARDKTWTVARFAKPSTDAVPHSVPNGAPALPTPQGGRDAATKTEPVRGIGPVAHSAPCKCGRPSNHFGRCWFRRGLPDPALIRFKATTGPDGQREEGRRNTGDTVLSPPPGPLDTDPRRLAIRIGRLEAAIVSAVRGRRRSLEVQLANIIEIENELTTEEA